MRLVIFNVKFSPNLGDGLLSECLERELEACGADVQVETIDIAGRTSFGPGGSNRNRLLKVMEWIPSSIRPLLAELALRRVVARRVRPQARSALATADAAVLGGGNLIADADLNFPVKVASVMSAVRQAGLPAAVFGVGVSDNWSRRGAYLFRQAFSGVRLEHAAVRDERSRDIWSRRLVPAGIKSAILCRDPGLMTARHFPAGGQRGSAVGLCLTNPLALRYHGAQNVGEQLDGWYLELARCLVRSGRRVVLFTNGSPEDRSYLATIASHLVSAGDQLISVQPAFDVPGDLARFIASCGIVIAHRMHACIAAFSYGVPHVGLRWDPKLDSFFASVGRGSYIVDPAIAAPAEVAALALHSERVGIADADRFAVSEQARAGVSLMVSRLSESAAR